MADLKRRRQRWQPRKRQLPGTIEPSSFTVTDSDGAVQTAAELTDSAEESIHFASSDADDAGADTASDTGDTTTMTRTIEGVLGHDGSTKLFTVTSTSTNLDDDASASSQEARNADGSTGSDSSDSNSTHIGLIVGLVVGLTVIVLALVLLVWRRCKRSKHASKLSDEGTSESREMEQQQQQQTATSTRSAPPMPPVPGRYPPSNGAATFQRQPSSSSSSYAGTKAMSPGLQEKNSAMDSDDYMSTSYAPAALHPSAARKASRKSSATKSTNRKSWFSLKSNKTLNCHFDYFRSSRHLDHDGEDEELRDLPPPDAAVFDRSSPLSELSEKAAMKMFRKPSTTESLRQGRPTPRRNPRLTAMTQDSTYSYHNSYNNSYYTNNARSRRDSDFDGQGIEGLEEDEGEEEVFGRPSATTTAHFSYSGDLPKSNSFIDQHPSRY